MTLQERITCALHPIRQVFETWTSQALITKVTTKDCRTSLLVDNVELSRSTSVQWVKKDAQRTYSLWNRAMILFLCTRTAPTGTSPSFAAFLASFNASCIKPKSSSSVYSLFGGFATIAFLFLCPPCKFRSMFLKVTSLLERVEVVFNSLDTCSINPCSVLALVPTSPLLASTDFRSKSSILETTGFTIVIDSSLASSPVVSFSRLTRLETVGVDVLAQLSLSISLSDTTLRRSCENGGSEETHNLRSEFFRRNWWATIRKGRWDSWWGVRGGVKLPSNEDGVGRELRTITDASIFKNASEEENLAIKKGRRYIDAALIRSCLNDTF